MNVEVKEVKVKVTASLDKEYRIILVTNDPKALELEKYIAADTVEINIG